MFMLIVKYFDNLHSNGNEVDVIIERGTKLMPVEIKSGRTVTPDSFAGLEKWSALAGDVAMTPTLVHGGEKSFQHKGVRGSECLMGHGWLQSFPYGITWEES